jgi:hypothetical protein
MVKQFQLYRWLRFFFLLAAGILIVIAPIKSFNIIIYIVSSYIAIYGILSIIDGLSIRKSTGEKQYCYRFRNWCFILSLRGFILCSFFCKSSTASFRNHPASQRYQSISGFSRDDKKGSDNTLLGLLLLGPSNACRYCVYLEPFQNNYFHLSIIRIKSYHISFL